MRHSVRISHGHVRNAGQNRVALACASNAWNRRSSPKRRSLLAFLQDASYGGMNSHGVHRGLRAVAPPASGATQSAFFPEHFVRFRIGSLGSFVKISPEARAAFGG